MNDDISIAKLRDLTDKRAWQLLKTGLSLKQLR